MPNPIGQLPGSDYLRRHTCYNTIWQNILVDQGARANDGVGPYADTSNDSDIHADLATWTN